MKDHVCHLSTKRHYQLLFSPWGIKKDFKTHLRFLEVSVILTVLIDSLSKLSLPFSLLDEQNTYFVHHYFLFFSVILIFFAITKSL